MTLAVNCSILLKHLPIPERLARAGDAGFDAVEFWWPFATARPTEQEVDAFASAVEKSGLELIALNLFAGDMPAGDRGVLSWPGREAELRASAEVAVSLGSRLGARRFNALYGNRIEGVDPAAQDDLAVRNLRALGALFDTIDAVLLLEPVSGAPRYPLLTADDVAAVLARADVTAAGILFDLYHLAVNGDDVDSAIAAHAGRAAHVQLADAPGRGVPGSGELPLTRWMAELRRRGYDGRVALEYSLDADDPFAELDRMAWKDLA